MNKLIEFFGRTQFGIDLSGVDDVVTVHAAWARFQNGRSIKVGDAEIRQVIDDSNCINKSEIAIELQPICRDRNSHDTFRSSGNAGGSILTERFRPKATKCSTHSRAIGSLANARLSQAG